jgi:hypothetical protein
MTPHAGKGYYHPLKAFAEMMHRALFKRDAPSQGLKQNDKYEKIKYTIS